MNVLFLAAGTSGRILKISKGKPKPLIKVKRRSILSRNFNWFNKSKLISRYFINAFFKPSEIEKEIKKINIRYKISTKISYEKKLLGTAGAVKKLEKQLGDLFFVVYSDNLMNFDLNKMLTYHIKKNLILLWPFILLRKIHIPESRVVLLRLTNTTKLLVLVNNEEARVVQNI